MKFKKGQNVNVDLTDDQMKKLGIAEIKNPCVITGTYENGVEGYYLKDGANKTKAVPEKLNAISLAE